MSVTYNHAQMNVVDKSGNVNVVYPQNYGEDVTIEKNGNTYLTEKNIDSAQEFAEQAGTDILANAADFSLDENVFKLLNGKGEVIREATIEGGANPSILTVTTNITELYNQTVAATIASGESLTGTFSSEGAVVFKLKYIGNYTISCGNISQIVNNPAIGTVLNVAINGTVLTVKTTTDDFIGATVTCVHTGGSQSLSSTFSSDGIATFALAYSGTYTVACNGYTTSVTSTGIGGDPITTKLDSTHIYGFHINSSESSPSAMITYPSDVLNANFTPAGMNYTTGTFDYGDWKEVLDDWLMPRPCMVKYDGTVDYYLNPDNYTLKEDGTSSDVANSSYGGNAMMEWGKNGKKIWYKVVVDSSSSDGSAATVYIADDQVDDDYVDYAFHNESGVSKDHFYTAIYNGSSISSKCRSISGQTPMNSQTGTTEITYAKANGTGWNTIQWCDDVLINYLLLLIGRNTNGQAQFGNGHYTGGSGASSLLKTGTMNTKGLFWGTNGTGSGVKVFGMENWWANIWRRGAGLINSSGKIKVKMTYGTEDGSTVTGYNTDGSGYITPGITLPSSGYISKQKVTKYGLFPIASSGSDSTYWCDYVWVYTSDNYYFRRGGTCGHGLICGPFCLDLDDTVSDSHWFIGSSPAYKPV